MVQANLDWKKLFADTKNKFGGMEIPADMTIVEIDKTGLEEAMNKQTFEDSDVLKQAVDQLKLQVPSSTADKLNTEEMQSLFEELVDLVSVNASNNWSLCLMGGNLALLEIMVGYSNEDEDGGDSIRKQACQLFNSITGNNLKVQSLAVKAGAINLAAQLEREKTPDMREAILGSLSAFMKAASFTAKRQYIDPAKGINGLDQLCRWLSVTDKAQIELLGKGAQQRKLKLKLIQLLSDLVINDDSILN